MNYICNDRYDLVIHLVSAARGAEKYYGTETNQSRFETLEEAKVLDERTVLQWVQHPNLKIIDNNCANFNEKINRVIDAISTLVKVPIPTHVNKYLLKKEINIKEIG